MISTGPASRQRRALVLALVATLCGAATMSSPAQAQLLKPLGTSITYEVDSDSVGVRIRLLGGIELDATVAFEEVLGLSKSGLGLSARLLSLSELLTIVQRLPSGLQLPAGFPVLLTIEPPSSGPLTFSGVVTLEIHTHNLLYLPDTPLRLFAAPLGGGFVDITETMGSGSYRARGVKGGFSQFLVVLETRSKAAVIDDKLGRLQGLLDATGELIGTEVLDQLQDILDAAAFEWTHNGDALAARELVDQFESTVRTHSGTAIPNVWRSSRDLVNVAGELRAAARTLRFSLNLNAG